MKKFLSLILSATLLTTSLVGCSSSSSTSGNSNSSEQTILIGGSGPLTGDYASYGISVSNGAKIAIEEINASGGANGIQLELKMEDDQADPSSAVSSYATLIDSGMKVSLGGVTSGACIAVSSETIKDGMLMITPSGSQKEIVNGYNAFRVCFNDPDLGNYSARFMAENNIASKIAILYDKSNDYSAGVTETFLSESELLGLNIVTQEAFTNQSNTDFSVQLQSIKSSGADLVFMPIYAKEAAYILTQANQIGLDVIFFGGDGLDGIMENIGSENASLTNGVMLLTPFDVDSSEPVISDFVASYKSKYNSTPDQFAADGYDAIYAIKLAIEKANITDVDDADLDEKLIKAMTEIELKGTTGTMTWGSDGEPVKSATVVTITDGKYVVFNN